MAKEQTEVKKVSRIKVRRKLWFKIIAPKVFGNKEMGESYIVSAESAMGRKMKLNLKDITGNVKDQNVYIQFQVTKAANGLLHTAVVGYELIPSVVKRMVRKMTSRLDDSFACTTKGGKELLMKTLIVTLHTAKRSTETQLRKELKKTLAEECSKTGFDNIIYDLVCGKYQTLLRKKLNKIFPLKEIGIRMCVLKSSGMASEEWYEDTPTVAAEEIAQ